MKHQSRQVDARGDYSVDTKNKYIETLHFKLFHDYFVFVEDGQEFKKRVLKKHFKVSVVIDLVSGDTRKYGNLRISNE